MGKKIKLFLVLLVAAFLLFFIFNDEIQDFFKEGKLFSKQSSEKSKILLGNLHFNDEDNKVVYAISNVLFNGDLIAIPTRLFINGTKWTFNLNNRLYDIDNGYWETDDVIGLWQVKNIEKNKISQLKLKSWNRNKNMIWVPLSNLNKKVKLSRIKKTRRFDNTEVFILPENINSAGIFLQNNYLVGWTFDSLLPYGILWNDEKGSSFGEDISYSYLYDNFCKNGQEYNFNKALLVEDGSPDKLRLLVKAVMLPNRFKKVNRNEELNRADLLKKIHEVSETLLADGNWKFVKKYLSLDVLIECDDYEIFNDALKAGERAHKYFDSIKLLDEIIISQNTSIGLKELATKEYIKIGVVQINELIKSGNNSDALTLFNKLYAKTKTNPEVNLIGVKLLIWLKDWVGAEHLLYNIHYPSKYNAQLAELKNKLADLKKETENKDYFDNKTVINFPTGIKGIHINGIVNDYTDQEFILDTGASLTTLPLSTLENLGVHVMMDSPKHRVSTAGGVISAREVHIDSINLNNCRVEDLNVLALDLPGEPGIGLLGMNFLKHFQIEINHEKGTLTLVPKDE
jgi:clan AA aspartic protease (TIGR02281 family)